MVSKMSTVPASSKTVGRQKVHIQVTYRGKGEPGKQLKEQCDTLVEMVGEADAGVIAERKAGNGAVDIYVVTGFADHTVETVRRTAKDLGIYARTTIKILAETKVDETKVEG
jgi:hypothetical protein